MVKRKHARDREDFLRIIPASTIVERQAEKILGVDLNGLAPSSVVTPTDGKYKGIHFTVEGFDATDYPDKPVKYQLLGKVDSKWIEIIVPSTKLKYLGKMPVKAWVRRHRTIPTRPITQEEYILEVARGAFSEPTDRVALIENEGEY